MVPVLPPLAPRHVALDSVERIMRDACGAALRLKPVTPPVVRLDAAVVHAYLPHPDREALTDLISLRAFNRAAPCIAGIIEDRTIGQRRHHLDKALINEV